MGSNTRNTDDDDEQARAPVRVDKWLWAARFFKTRSLASSAVKGGKVRVNNHRAKASTGLRIGDRLEITKGEIAYEIVIDGLSEKRGPARDAIRLYTETRASEQAREQQAFERRAARQAIPRPMGRPDKKQRRELRRFKQGE